MVVPGEAIISDGSLDAVLSAVEGASAGTKFEVKLTEAAAEVKDNMTLAGLVNLRVKGDFVLGELPNYAVGEKIALPQVAESKAENEDEEDGNELVDEDELLERDGLQTDKCPPKNAEEIATAAKAGRKPCKDCSCGLKDVYDNEGEVNSKAAAKSNCGNCSLGDAFRCAGCPYLGLPPFKPGEKVSISDSLMTSDI